MKNFIIEVLAFGITFMVISYLAGTSITVSVAIGAASGLLFASLLTIVTHILQSKLMKSVPEGYLHTEAANYLIGAEAVGGRVFFYNDRLEFHAHMFNFTRTDLCIPYNEIKNIEYSHFPEKVELSLISGTDIAFIVNSGSGFAENLTNYAKK